MLKRKSEPPSPTEESKKLRATLPDDDGEDAQEIPITVPNVAPDSHINHKNAIAYWSATEATVNGVLGGYPQVSRVDIQGSSNFLAKLRRQSKEFPPGEKLSRVVDCGAGIGRITTGFLTKVADEVDVVEPVKKFTDQIKGDGVGQIYNVGLEEWKPEGQKYDVIWNQWCVGQLTDVQFVDYLKRIQPMVSKGGWIVVKENLSNHHLGEDVFDEDDSSVTRTDEKFRDLFAKAELKIVSTELQKGMPKSLYPVRVYALQPA